MIITALLFFLGLILLVKGADMLVDHAQDFAKQVGLSPMIIGLTIVAFGGSVPEFLVSTLSALKGYGDLALGNVIGSNIANIGLILGVSATITPLVLKQRNVLKEMTILIVGALILFILPVLHQQRPMQLNRFDGMLFLLIFVVTFFYMAKTARAQRKAFKEQNTESKWFTKENIKHMALIVGGLVSVLAGARITVDSAVVLARFLGVSEAVIAISVVSIGTSLPELMASAMAAYKGHSGLAIGNVVGSNIFNQFFVLGSAALVAPLPFHISFYSDIGAMLLFTVALMFLLMQGKQVRREHGVLFLIFYVLFIIQLF